MPGEELGSVATNAIWDDIYERLAELAVQHRSTLVFVNTRRMAERLAFCLGERLGAENVAAHHGSLSRKLRLEAERKLKNGEIRLLVATASLELGIDIGSIDLVCQVNSPRAIARGHAARGPRRPLARSHSQGTLLRHHARRSGGVRGADPRHAGGGARPAGDSPMPDWMC